MNCIWNKNIEGFQKRFPALFSLCSEKISSFQNNPPKLFEIQNAKSGAVTASSNGLFLHSRYNPEREAQQLTQSFNPEVNTAAVFFSFGLGYSPLEFAVKFPQAPVILIEPDISFMLEAFTYMDFETLFNHEKLLIVTEASPDEAAHLLDRYNIEKAAVFEIKNQTAHAFSYFEDLRKAVSNQKKKNEINLNTQERFSHLWLKNSCKNLHHLIELNGIQKFQNKFQLPFLILAAGPSLTKILPLLSELKKHCVIVCVDTALHSCLQVNVEPDFIILADPQYACYLHLEFLSSPSSVLITEQAVYPSVFDFKCRETVLFSSMIPLGKYFESFTGTKGLLQAGGSVTTTAWDFACFCGASEIFIAGMDLGFPEKQTHVRGSQFEEKIHRISNRVNYSETQNLNSLFSADIYKSKDYSGNEIVSDQRMNLFSWWFEVHVQQALENGIKTYSVTKESLYITGIEPFEAVRLIEKPDCTKPKSLIFKQTEFTEPSDEEKNNFTQAFKLFTDELENIKQLSDKAVEISDKAILYRTNLQNHFKALEQIDTQIKNSKCKAAIDLVFPTKRQLEKKEALLDKKSPVYLFEYSKLIYSELNKVTQEYLTNLQINR